jgi:hypothetical protein
MRKYRSRDFPHNYDSEWMLKELHTLCDKGTPEDEIRRRALAQRSSRFPAARHEAQRVRRALAFHTVLFAAPV